MARDPWSPDRYARFAAERKQPFVDLVALVDPTAVRTIVDLGCGPGELTRELHDTLGAERTVGVDTSDAMLAKAAAHANDAVTFVKGDLATFTGGPFDLVLSNAAIHWAEDHAALLAHLTTLVAPGGQLAIQVPANHHHPSQTIAAEIAQEPPFREALDGWYRRSPVLAPGAYARCLHTLGYVEQHVRLVVYPHVLESRDDVVEWVRGTTLTDYERRMPAALWPRFLDRYRARLAEVLPDDRPFFFPFERILFRGRI
ncbi:methyltransferase domain-containing protein [Myxococcota bacterium]|nr:methyltransferase domain-containing protein [Myxococcota bacterium]